MADAEPLAPAPAAPAAAATGDAPAEQTLLQKNRVYRGVGGVPATEEDNAVQQKSCSQR